MPIFRHDEDRHIYVQMLLEQARLHNLRFLAWCLMTNHVHFVVVPAESATLARAVGEAHRRYTWRRNRDEGVRGYLFQGRFYSCPLDEAHGHNAIAYIERNPVRAGLVQQPWEYPWSSAAFRTGHRADDPLLTDKDRLGTPQEWLRLLASDPADVPYLRKCTCTGRPCGGGRFVARAERVTGRTLQPRAPGRPRKEEEDGCGK